jgi:hypothetical protein
MTTDNDAEKDKSQIEDFKIKKIRKGDVEASPPLPVQTNDDPRGHVGARDEQVDHTLTPPAPEESVEKVSN